MELYTEAMKFTVGTLHIKTVKENKDKTRFFTKMLRPGEKHKQKLLQEKKKDARHSYCTYKTESALLSIHVFTTHTITIQGSLLALLLEASYLTSWYNTSNK